MTHVTQPLKISPAGWNPQKIPTLNLEYPENHHFTIHRNHDLWIQHGGHFPGKRFIIQQKQKVVANGILHPLSITHQSFSSCNKPWKINKCPPKKGPFQEERIVLQPTFFRGHVGFRGCNIMTSHQNESNLFFLSVVFSL